MVLQRKCSSFCMTEKRKDEAIWVGKSADFTNPFVCGTPPGESEKTRSCVTYVVDDTVTKFW